MVMFFSAAMRSASGGCVLKSPESICPGLNGATIKSDEVVGETFIGMRWLYAPNFSSALISPYG